MSEELYVDGLGLAPGVMETIIAIAAKDVEGVANIDSAALSDIVPLLSGKPVDKAIDVSMNEQSAVEISIHMDVDYGRPIPEIAADVRQAVYDAVTTQVGFAVGSVDVYVDGIRFNE